jgi:uncharacterized protein (TIGR03086 family)
MVTVSHVYESATQGFARRLAKVGDEHWDSPTPCTDWTVRMLVGHVLDEQLWVPPLVDGESIADVGDRFAGDQIGTDAMAAWARACDDVATRLAQDGIESRTVGLSYGESPALDYVQEVAIDTVIHTWDLARAIGADDALDAELVTLALAELAPKVDAFRAGGAFGPEVHVPPDVSDQTRLLAILGRRA